jgi:predicted MFS family arabinose efflux permease
LKPPGVLAERDFRLVLVVWGLSGLGDFVAVVALTLRVQEATDSGFAVAALLVAAGLPILLFNPIAGWLVDHREARTLLSVVAALQVVVAVALAEVESTAATIALVFVLNCGLAVERPALFALIPRIVGEASAGRAYAWFESVKYAAFALGAVIGGVVTGALDSRAALLIDAATFALTALAALAIRTRRAPAAGTPATAVTVRATDTADPPEAGGARAFTAGIRLLTADRVLRATTLVVVAAVVFGGIDNIAGVFLARDSLGAGAAGYGALAGSWGVGMIAGAALAGRRARLHTAAMGVLLATALMGAAIAATAASPHITLAVVCFLLGGAGNGYENVAMRVLLQGRVPDALRGRAYAAFQGVVAPADFIALALGGALIQLVGPRPTFALAGAGTLVAVAAVVPTMRRARDAAMPGV